LNYPARKLLTLESIEKKEMDKKYELVTLMLDGTHIPIWDKSEHPGGDFYSYKNKDNAFNILVIYL
jgi:hypothetical protein